MSFKLHTDGGARGNPGPGGIGVVLENPDGEIIYEMSKYVGECTNNEAEYAALYTGLRIASIREIEDLEVFVDSELVAKQVRGEYKVKSPHLKSIHKKVQNLANNFKKISFTHVKRSANKRADALVNEALDSNGF